MSTSRSEYVAKNTAVTLATQVIKNILSFISRTVFIYVLGAEYLGVNGLFTEILAVLSFAELGVGNALVYSMYKPLAEKDEDKLKSLMKLYAQAYRVIGIVILVAGACLIPFLPRIIGETSYIKENITLLYILSLAGTVSSYFLVYKKSMIIADQKMYVVNIYEEIFHALAIILQSVFLIITREFIVYQLISIGMGVLNNIWVAHKANQMYPFLKDKKIQKLDKAEVYTIVKNVKALFIYKVAGTILESTDNIFISALINVVTVGLYSNYRLIVNIFKNIGGQIMNSAVASIGNMQATSDVEKKKEIFYELLFACAWFYGFTASGLFVFLSEFIEIWLGDTYILSTAEVMAICIYYYIQHMNYVADIYRNTAGLFALCKWVPVLAAILNIALDILLGIHFGLVGIVWATIISRSVSMNIVDPVLVYKNVLKGNVMGYFLKNAIYGLSTILIMEISKGILSVIQLHGLYGIIVKAIIFTVMFNSIFLLVNFKNKAKCDLIRRLRQLVIRRR